MKGMSIDLQGVIRSRTAALPALCERAPKTLIAPKLFRRLRILALNMW